MHKWIYVNSTKKTGDGIFASKSFSRGQTIFVIQGKKKKYNGRILSRIGSRWIGIGKNKWINPFRNNPAWFMNHSCNPNAGRKGLYKVVALKEIKKNQEITMDYSITEEDPLWHMNCLCGQKKCRKIIRSIQFLPKNVFNIYSDFIPNFLVKIFMESRINDAQNSINISSKR